MKRIIPWVALSAITLFAIAFMWDLPKEVSPTNVLIIVADTTRLDDLSVYGGKAETPNLQSLRRDGVLFHQTFSVAYGTTPSHASLFTSNYAQQHGIYDNKTVLGEEFITLAELLSSNGFGSSAFVSSPAVRRELGFGQGFDAYFQPNSPPGDPNCPTTRRTRRDADETVDCFLSWLPSDGPFLAWVHLVDPHSPLRATYRVRAEISRRRSRSSLETRLYSLQPGSTQTDPIRRGL